MTHDEFMRRMAQAVKHEEGSDVVNDIVMDRANTISDTKLDQLMPGWRVALQDSVELSEIDRDDIAERESEARQQYGANGEL